MAQGLELSMFKHCFKPTDQKLKLLYVLDPSQFIFLT